MTVTFDVLTRTGVRRGVPALFRPERPLVSFTFDDNGSEDMTVIKPLLDANGIKGGFCTILNGVGEAGRTTWDNLRTLQAAGNEIVNHSDSHPTPFISLTESQMRAEINGPLATYADQGINIAGFCWPGTGSNALARSIARESHLYAMGGTATGQATQPVATYSINRQKIDNTKTWDGIKALIDGAVSTNTFLIFYCHPHQTGGEFDAAALALLTQAIDYVQSLSIQIVTPREGFKLVGNIIDVGDSTDPAASTVLSGSGKLRSPSNISKIVTGSGTVLFTDPPSSFTLGATTEAWLSAADNGVSSGWPLTGVVAYIVTILRNSAASHGYDFQYFHTDGRSWVRRGNAAGLTSWGTFHEIGANAGPIRVTAGGTAITAATPPNDAAFAAGTVTWHSMAAGSNGDWPFPGVAADVLTWYLYTGSYVYMRQEITTNPASGVSRRAFRYGLVDGSGWGSWTEMATTLATVNAQTGTTYTLALTDAGLVVELSNAAAITVTVPPNSTAAFALGTVIELCQYGAGQVSVVAGSGVTVNSPSGKAKIAAQYGAATLRKRGTNEWMLEGNLSA